jgi:hypothetical protein
MWKINSKPLEDSIVQVKLAIIFSKVWPDVILAKSRIDKVKTLMKYEIISIAINNGIITSGTFLGKKIEKNLIPWTLIPMIFMPIKTDKAKPNVNIIWLVTVKV